MFEELGHTMKTDLSYATWLRVLACYTAAFNIPLLKVKIHLKKEAELDLYIGFSILFLRGKK